MPRSIAFTLWTLLIALLAGVAAADNPTDPAALAHFEQRVRPLLVEHCYKCHSAKKSEAGLRLDSAESLRLGGESGAAVTPRQPDESLLIQAVRYQNGLEMPPDGKLTETQVADLAAWVKSGAVWPPSDQTEPASAASQPAAAGRSMSPDEADLAESLQLWLRADDLELADGAAVTVWPDRSGHHRDLASTHGKYTGGVGAPAHLVKQSTVQRRPAVRFDSAAGMATAPGNPVAIEGDAELSILLAINLQRNTSDQMLDGVLGLGNPAPPTDPGKPMAALVAVDRADQDALMLAGGWHHDASLGSGSFKAWYGQPILLTVVKHAGPMRTSTQVYINGVPSNELFRQPLVTAAIAGSLAVPDIQHRSDIGLYMGKAVAWAGSFVGDVGEVVVYNKCLSDAERQAVEGHLADKYCILVQSQIAATRATFTAEEQRFWAYQPLSDPPPSPVNVRTGTPVDNFILAAASAKGLSPAPAADKRTLIRRVTFDLIGLPPTPAEIGAYLADDSPQAFAKLVDRLLASPRYGEHWGRHWLDVVRYADTTANDGNAVMRYAWRYRNYVIDALNRDLPYDEFLIEQLAGDLLPPSDDIDAQIRRTVATGFLMVGPKALAETDKEQTRLDIVDDQIDVVSRSLLGLTVGCARCHDHKFDAIRTVDYYALAGILRSTEPFRSDDRNASMWWEFPLFQPPGEDPFVVMAPREASPKNLRVHVRGNHFTLGQTAPRGFPQVISPAPPRIAPQASGRLELARWIASRDNPLTARVMVNRVWQHHFGQGLVATSDNFGVRGDRPTHPELLDYLASRFIESGWSIKALHRLILLSDAYQQQCAPPEQAAERDPENLLRTHFSRRRLTAEQLRDAMLLVAGKLDLTPDKGESTAVLWQKAEVADAKAEVRPNRMTSDDPFYTSCVKRSVYLPIVRNLLPDVLALFDGADPNAVAAVRGDTTVPSQELFLLNSPLVRDLARSFATRLLADDKLNDEQRLDLAQTTALGRPCRPEELQQAKAYLAAYEQAPAATSRPAAERRLSAWQSYCQALLCENEFLYCD